MAIISRIMAPVSDHVQLPGLVQEEEETPVIHVNQRVIGDVEVPVQSQTESPPPSVPRQAWLESSVSKDHSPSPPPPVPRQAWIESSAFKEHCSSPHPPVPRQVCIESRVSQDYSPLSTPSSPRDAWSESLVSEDCNSSNANDNAQGEDRSAELSSTLKEILESIEPQDFENATSLIPDASLPEETSTDTSLARSVTLFAYDSQSKTEINKARSSLFLRVLHQIRKSFLLCLGKGQKEVGGDSSKEEDTESILAYFKAREEAQTTQSEVDKASLHSLKSGLSCWSYRSVEIESFEDQIQAKNEDAYLNDLSYSDLSIYTNDSGDTLDSRVVTPKKKPGRFRKFCRRVSRSFQKIRKKK